MNFPQLRIRTGFSTFVHEAYGRMPEIFETLDKVGTKTAAIVDVYNTWGHVKFEKEAKKHGIQPAFGMEVPLVVDDESKFKPRAWMLATDTRRFYNATSEVVQNDKKMTVDRFGQLPGVIRFVGGAHDMANERPACFDYVDVNPASLLHASNAIRLARATDLPMVLTSNPDMPSTDHKPYAYAWRVRESVGNRVICDVDGIWNSLRHVMSKVDFDSALANTFEVEKKLQGIALKRAPLIHLEGSLSDECRKGIERRVSLGHIKEWTKEYEDRLVEELSQIEVKDFASYFLLVADMIQFAKTKMLVGPARGSSSGSIVCFLIGITEVDPLVHNLMFQRFIDISRGGFEYENFKGFGDIPFEVKS